MQDVKQAFIELIKKRSEENEKALTSLFSQNLIGNCISVLRQELDSFVRIMYLGRISDISNRERLMQQTLNGQKWNEVTINGKLKTVTDRDMVDKSSELKGYIQYVYKFGCGFIHLSDFHNYESENPFDKLEYSEQFDIKLYLHQYHGFPRDGELSISTLRMYIPSVFEKISSNMACYYGSLINDEMIEL